MHLDRPELDALFSAAYEELRRLATRVSRDDPAATLSPTALVNEAYLRLVRAEGIEVESELHFKRIAARAMRQVLVEGARRRREGGASRRASPSEPRGDPQVPDPLEPLVVAAHGAIRGSRTAQFELRRS